MLSRKMEGKHVWKIIHLRMPLGPQVGSLLFSRNKMAYSQVEGESMMERSITVTRLNYYYVTARLDLLL